MVQLRKRRRTTTQDYPSKIAKLDSDELSDSSNESYENASSSSSNNKSVIVYFDYRLLLTPTPIVQDQQHKSHHRDCMTMRNMPLSVSKQMIPCSVLLTELKSIIQKNISTISVGPADPSLYKINQIKLYEVDSSGAKLEVDLIDDDSFIICPIEDKTRFVVYCELE
jgi:hypothetical protein